jgi:hypothetical protein
MMIPASFDIFSILSMFIYGPRRLNHIGLWGFLFKSIKQPSSEEPEIEMELFLALSSIVI